MPFRHHAQLWADGRYLWPPSFQKVNGPGPDALEDESAILTSVTLSRIDPPMACHLTVELNGSSYIGMLQLEDPIFCQRLCKFLQAHIGKTLQVIGDLDFS